jgi:hypothetical protein
MRGKMSVGPDRRVWISPGRQQLLIQQAQVKQSLLSSNKILLTMLHSLAYALA